MKLDWGQKKWFLEKDEAQPIWERVGFSQKGPFEPQTGNETIWLWDEPHIHNTVIFWDAPASETVSRNNSGKGRIFDPKDPAFKEGKIEWTIESAAPPALSPLRQRALAELVNLIPARYPKSWPTTKDGLTTKGPEGNWAKNVFSSLRQKAKAGYTNCVEFPAYLVLVLNGGKKKLNPGFPPNTTKGWTDAGGGKRPLPGDIFILLNPGDEFGHVGVIYDTSWKSSKGLLWRTADWGQGDGWDGDWVERTYDPVKGTLTGGPNSPRKILGWVDLDELFK
jgi:hypothetical protein